MPDCRWPAPRARHSNRRRAPSRRRPRSRRLLGADDRGGTTTALDFEASSRLRARAGRRGRRGHACPAFAKLDRDGVVLALANDTARAALRAGRKTGGAGEFPAPAGGAGDCRGEPGAAGRSEIGGGGAGRRRRARVVDRGGGPPHGGRRRPRRRCGQPGGRVGHLQECVSRTPPPRRNGTTPAA